MTLTYCSVETLNSPVQIGGQADITTTINTTNTHAAWIQHADDLAAWVERIQIRDDYAQWIRFKDKQKKDGWRCLKQKEHPLAMKLRGHFSGHDTLGMYTTHPKRQTCKFFGLDIDAHEGQDVDVVANWLFALRCYNELRAMGLHPMLEDSNGKGGYHVWVLFDNEVFATHLYALGCWLRKYTPNGVCVEAFPKQPTIMEIGYGNQMRLPGKHHKSAHWSGIYDAPTQTMVYDMKAIQLILACPLSKADNIPSHVLQYVEQKTPTTPNTTATTNTQDNQTAGDWMQAYSGDLKTLDIEKLCEDRIAGRSSNGFIDIVCPWHKEHTTGDWAGIAKQDDSYPVFSCLHAHCKDRKLRELLAFYGVEAVNKCCAKQYGGAERLPDATELDDLITPFDLPDDDIPQNVTQTHNPPVSLDDPYMDDERPYVAKENPNGVNEPSDKYKFYTLAELRALPRKKWLIHSQFMQNSFVCVYGQEGTAKSFLALDWALCLASGIPWQGTYAVAQCQVALICSEEPEMLYPRIQAWQKHYDISDEVLGLNFQVNKSRHDLCNEEEAKAIVAATHKHFGKYPGLIIVDTLSRNFGGNENDGKDMGKYVRNLDFIKDTTQGTVLSIHHSGKDLSKNMRGHTTLAGACDTIISCSRNKDKEIDMVHVAMEKQKSATEIERYVLNRRILTVGVDDIGDAITSCYWERGDKWQSRLTNLKPSEKALFEHIVNIAKSGSFYVQQLPNETWKIRTIHEHLATLKRLKLICCEKEGKEMRNWIHNEAFKTWVALSKTKAENER